MDSGESPSTNLPSDGTGGDSNPQDGTSDIHAEMDRLHVSQDQGGEDRTGDTDNQQNEEREQENLVNTVSGENGQAGQPSAPDL